MVFKYDNSRLEKLIKLYLILFFTKPELRALGQLKLYMVYPTSSPLKNRFWGITGPRAWLGSKTRKLLLSKVNKINCHCERMK